MGDMTHFNKVILLDILEIYCNKVQQLGSESKYPIYFVHNEIVF